MHVCFVLGLLIRFLDSPKNDMLFSDENEWEVSHQMSVLKSSHYTLRVKKTKAVLFFARKHLCPGLFFNKSETPSQVLSCFYEKLLRAADVKKEKKETKSLAML